MGNKTCCLILTYSICQSNLSLKIGTILGINKLCIQKGGNTWRKLNSQTRRVRNYLELMRDTEALIGDGMEKLKGANWAKLWSSLDKLVFLSENIRREFGYF